MMTRSPKWDACAERPVSSSVPLSVGCVQTFHLPIEDQLAALRYGEGGLPNQCLAQGSVAQPLDRARSCLGRPHSRPARNKQRSRPDAWMRFPPPWAADPPPVGIASRSHDAGAQRGVSSEIGPIYSGLRVVTVKARVLFFVMLRNSIVVGSSGQDTDKWNVSALASFVESILSAGAAMNQS